MIYTQNKDYTLYKGTMQEELSNLEDNSVDSIVTDPPYELGFMGKCWDSSGVAFQKETWQHCLRVLKPGGYLLAFGGTRTYHRICCAIEDAGFEIRDCIMWLYGSGFPKSMNIGLAIDKHNGVESEVVGTKKQSGAKFKLTQELIDNGGFNDPNRKEFDIKRAQNKWDGWGTCLKPAYEPIIVARKPCEGSITENVIKYGVGGINIDDCRVPIENEVVLSHNAPKGTFAGGEYNRGSDTSEYRVQEGRFPANVITDGSDEVAEGFPVFDHSNGSITKNYKMNNQVYGDYGYCNTWEAYQDSGSAMRYFYCAKASKKDRDEGLEGKNTHCTVKPVSLMSYLVRLVSPKGATILDPFMGSGSTGKAVMFENRERNSNYKFIGVEMTDEYLPICKARIDFANNYDDVQVIVKDTANNEVVEKSVKYKTENLF